MKTHKSTKYALFGSQGGVSLIELITVILLMGILMAMAIPSFVRWRENMEYREAARNIVVMLRDARGRAISTNLQHQMEIDVPGRRVRLSQGDRAWNSQVWTPIQSLWLTLPGQVNISAGGVTGITYAPNGTAAFSDPALASATINVLDLNAAMRFQVTVALTGRIQMQP